MENEHDKVIAALEAHLRNLGRNNILANPGQEKNAPLKMQDGTTTYPDLIVTGKRVWNGVLPDELYEVEDPHSVTDKEAAQWKRYAEEVECGLIVVVPYALLTKAKGLILNHIIENISVHRYAVGADGTITFPDTK